jgi:cell wall assembly regulator SMI1
MSYTLDNLNAAMEALDRKDYAEARSRIKYLIQRMEKMLEQRKFWTAVAKGEYDGDNRRTETGAQESPGQQRFARNNGV